MEDTLSMKEYNEKQIFDNLEADEKQEFSAFSLESYIRSAAQRMIQAARGDGSRRVFATRQIR